MSKAEDFIELALKWRVQSETEFIAGFDLSKFSTDAEAALRVGFRRGWQEAISTLSLHDRLIR